MKSPPRFVCNYALLRYLPYPERGEFVNVGIVVHCAEVGWCGYEEDDCDAVRVTQFFPAVKAEDYVSQKRAMIMELDRVRNLIQGTADKKLARSIFLELVRPRESLLRFGELRTAMTDDPAALVVQLCDLYVRQKLPVSISASAQV